MAKSETEGEMYSLICEKRFDSIERKQDEVLDLLRGKNRTPGLVEEVRGLKKIYKIIIGTVTFVVSVSIVQFIIWIREKVG